MTKEQALEMLKNAPQGKTPSRINNNLTEMEAVRCVREWVETATDMQLNDPLLKKRVYQVCQNRIRPTMV